MMIFLKRILLFLLIGWTMVNCQEKEKQKIKAAAHPKVSVNQVMDDIVSRIYDEVPYEELNKIDSSFLNTFLTEDEKRVLSTGYWYFKTNVPVVLSVMKNKDQKQTPFWLAQSGFQKTGKVIKNEHYEYEVWTKNFDAGLVEVGINGFDKHRPVYFLSVAPQNPNDALAITDIFPDDQVIDTLKKGKHTYHDWSELVLTEIPPSMEGQLLFQTVRGRAREAHLINAFRHTPFPSSLKPDQIMLSWSESPKSSIDIQWRISSEVETGFLRYWIDEKGGDTMQIVANLKEMEDRLLANDRFVNRFTAKLKNLNSGTRYAYQIGDGENWTDPKHFSTEAAASNHFSFIWFGDTHRSEAWGNLLQSTAVEHPEVAFYSIAGDLVTTGLYRDEWDKLFAYSGDVFAEKPLMPVPGNHDRQDGLGAWMYQDLFSLPENGPDKVDPESTYSFTYGNALFLMIDATFPVEDQSEWIEHQLEKSNAKWKFAVFHFPPYNFESPYPEIHKEWIPLFDRYHLDMAMSGHIHYYMRSKPMNGGKVVNSFDKGTVYVTSIGTQGNHEEIGLEPYAEKRYRKGQFYQHIEIRGDSLIYHSYNNEGVVADFLTITKE